MTYRNLHPTFVHPKEGLTTLWLGDCSGWEMGIYGLNAVQFSHRCGFITPRILANNFLGNVVADWWKLKEHSCQEYS